MANTDNRTGGEIIIDNVHHKVYMGKFFIATYKSPDGSPMADNGSIDFLIINDNRLSHFSFMAHASTLDIEIAIYENPTVSPNGTLVDVISLNRDFEAPQNLAVWRGPTISDVGDLIYNAYSGAGLGLILNENVSYLCRAFNRSGSTKDMSVMAAWDIP